MISLGSTNAGSSDIYTAPVPVTVTAPTGAYFVATKLYLGFISDVPLVAGDRTIHVQVKQDAAEDSIVLEGDWFINVAAGDVAKWFTITLGEFPWYLDNDLIVTVSSDNSNDTDVTLSVVPFTADADYLLNRAAAVGSPLADSLTERIKAIDNKLPSSSYLLGSSSASGQINAATFAAGAINAAAIADAAIDAATFATDVDAEVRSYLGMAAANLDTQIGTLATATALVTVDTVVDANKALLENATYGLAALRTRGDLAWITATSVTVSDKTGFSLAATGADLILKDSTFALALADAVWDEILSGHAVVGSSGAALSASGAAADPWSTLIPGSYTAGMAGYIVGTYLDAAISGIGGATGSGAVEDTLTFYYDVAETQPIDGAEVWITNDVAGVDGGSVIAGTLVTDSSGIVTFALDTGTYWVHLQKGGYNFTTTYPRQLTVAAGGFSWA